MEGSRFICTMCVIGSAISIYAVYVEQMSHSDPNYVAMCDLSEEISCSKVLSGEYGKILSKFGLIASDSALDYSNAAYGLLYYIFMIIVSLLNTSRTLDILRLVAASAAILFSCYLAYLLAYVLKDLCLVVWRGKLADDQKRD